MWTRLNAPTQPRVLLWQNEFNSEYLQNKKQLSVSKITDITFI